MERHFDEELAELKKNLLQMGYLVEKAILDSLDALKELSCERAQRVITDDKIIDERELKIDEQCLDILGPTITGSTTAS